MTCVNEVSEYVIMKRTFFRIHSPYTAMEDLSSSFAGLRWRLEDADDWSWCRAILGADLAMSSPWAFGAVTQCYCVSCAWDVPHPTKAK